MTSTKPLVLIDGTVVRNLRVRFEGGRAVQVDADSAQDVMRTIVGRDEGAARLGEVALVDGEGRIGKLDTVFYDTLLDENAASHIALGQGFPFLAEGSEPDVNESAIHIDFMIGSEELKITGITADGERVPARAGGPDPGAALTEREGFEPSDEVDPRHTISSRARSAAPAPLLDVARERVTRAARAQICQRPPVSTGTRSPSRVRPEISSASEPIMKSMWIWLELVRSRSASSTTNGNPWPNAMWLAAFSSSSVS